MAFLSRFIGGPRNGEQIPLDVIAPSVVLRRYEAGGTFEDRYDLITDNASGWNAYEFVRSVKYERPPEAKALVDTLNGVIAATVRDLPMQVLDTFDTLLEDPMDEADHAAGEVSGRSARRDARRDAPPARGGGAVSGRDEVQAAMDQQAAAYQSHDQEAIQQANEALEAAVHEMEEVQ